MDGANGDLQQQLARPQVPYEALPARLRSESSEAASAGSPSRRACRRRFGGAKAARSRRGFARRVGGPRVLQRPRRVRPRRTRVRRVRARARRRRAPRALGQRRRPRPRSGSSRSELGAGFTWSENSRLNRLTPWQNDPVCDSPVEAMYLCDQDTGQVWTATPLPSGDGHQYTVRHGQGFTSYEHTRDGIDSHLRLFVPSRESVKIFQLAVRNRSRRPRRVSVTLYVEWALGEDRSRSRLHIVTGLEPVTGAVIASNAFRETFSGRVAFIDLSPADGRSVTGDRTEFIGRNGTLTSPAALGRAGLSGRTGAALDPCGAIQVQLTLKPLGRADRRRAARRSLGSRRGRVASSNAGGIRRLSIGRSRTSATSGTRCFRRSRFGRQTVRSTSW